MPENEEQFAIRVKNVSKGFKIYYDKGASLKERLLFRGRDKYHERVVLKDISLDIKRGEVIGLIGHNGCGKSTLLKLMTKILYPDSGEIEVNGRVSSLLELGAGFHPDMSGRENIYTNASIFGLSKKEIDRRLDAIISFSELEEFIDNPVRTYSSGMYMRLAFSVAINVDADVLLIDEILAVGDTNFQAKCFNKLQEIKSNGTTIVIVSHSLNQIESICNRSIWIHDGGIKADGFPNDVHMDYLTFMSKLRQIKSREIEEESNAAKAEIAARKAAKEAKELARLEEERRREAARKRWGSRECSITNIYAGDLQGNDNRVIRVGDPIKFRIDYRVDIPIKDAVFGIGIFRADGMYVYGTNTRIENFKKFDLEKDGSFTIVLERYNMLPGKYIVGFSIEYGDGIPVDYWKTACEIETYSEVSDVGSVRLDHTWEFSQDGIEQ
ncbi:MAG: ABC transporter ATP-binding protein [Clostridiales bacterium]|nr:ABC transporter ATP-binding protein [Clostridiales bacterium]